MVAGTIVETPDQDPFWNDHPFGHSYSYGEIQTFVNLVLHAPTSLRGASGAMRVFAPAVAPGQLEAPSPNAGANWLLRIGLYELTRPLEVADDWVWIVDHTIQLGDIKCLLIVGLQLSAWQQLDRPLAHQDLTLVALEPSASSKSEIVVQQLQKAVLRTGLPRAILSDGARDLKRAIEDFRVQHGQVANLYDSKHKIALLLKHRLEKDSLWQEFVKKSSASRSQLMQNALAYLVPPTLKNKARYMNLGELVDWAVKARAFLDAPTLPNGQELNIGKLNITLGWLRQYDQAIGGWNELLRVAETGLEYMRIAGYHAQASEELAKRLMPVATMPNSRELADALLGFVATESTKTLPGEQLPASSEVLESLIGRGKRLEGQQSHGGFTKMVLGMAAGVVTPTRQFIQKALENVKTRHVTDWVRQKLGISLQSQRRLAFQTPEGGTKPA